MHGTSHSLKYNFKTQVHVYGGELCNMIHFLSLFLSSFTPVGDVSFVPEVTVSFGWSCKRYPKFYIKITIFCDTHI